MIALSDYLILSAIVFCIGLAGIFINRTNIIMLLMCVELILAAVLLLIAIIAAITLVHRKESRSKRQNISEQVSVQASDRVRLASISSSKSKGSK